MPSGNVEPIPDPNHDENDDHDIVKCVCESNEENRDMLQCESCSARCHNLHVSIYSQVAANFPRNVNVTNIKRTLDTQEHQVLSLGLNFAFCPTKVPTDDIICRTEQVASLLKEKSQPLREEVSRCLCNFAMLKHTFN